MSRKRNKPPAHRRHKSHDCGYVVLNGRQIYTGPWGSEEAEEKYRQLVAEWALHGDRPPPVVKPTEYRIRDLVADYLVRCKTYYVEPNGGPSREVSNINHALVQLVRIYGSLPVVEFSPLKLQATRQELIEEGLHRSTINRRVGIIKRMFKWGVAQELVPEGVLVAINTVDNLKRNRSLAKEGKPVLPVPQEDFEATLPYLSPTVAAMARLQWLTGMRSGELVQMRWMDIEKPAGGGP